MTACEHRSIRKNQFQIR